MKKVGLNSVMHPFDAEVNQNSDSVMQQEEQKQVKVGGVHEGDKKHKLASFSLRSNGGLWKSEVASTIPVNSLPLLPRVNSQSSMVQFERAMTLPEDGSDIKIEEHVTGANGLEDITGGNSQITYSKTLSNKSDSLWKGGGTLLHMRGQPTIQDKQPMEKWKIHYANLWFSREMTILDQDGCLCLDKNLNLLKLSDNRGIIVDHRRVRKNEQIVSGRTIFFPRHIVVVGQKLEPRLDLKK